MDLWDPTWPFQLTSRCNLDSIWRLKLDSTWAFEVVSKRHLDSMWPLQQASERHLDSKMAFPTGLPEQQDFIVNKRTSAEQLQRLPLPTGLLLYFI